MSQPALKRQELGGKVDRLTILFYPFLRHPKAIAAADASTKPRKALLAQV